MVKPTRFFGRMVGKWDVRPRKPLDPRAIALVFHIILKKIVEKC